MLDAALSRYLPSRRLALCLCAAGGTFLAGCNEPSLLAQYLAAPGETAHPPTGKVVAAPPPRVQPATPKNIQLVKQELLPVPVAVAAPAAQAAPVLPISLDTVLRLAEEQNRQIGLARVRLAECETERQLAARSWLPQVYAGVGYFRHEGSIQNEDGTITHSSFGSLFPGMSIDTELDVKAATFRRVDACRKLWQQKGEVSKVTYETLLDAATTYVDLLAARRGETVGEEIAQSQQELLQRVDKLNTDGSLKILAESLKTEIAGRKQAMSKLHQQGDAASMKLAYLLGLPYKTVLVPTDRLFAPIELVDASPTVDDLVQRAVTSGPGIRELEGLVETINGGIAELDGPKKYFPVIQLTAIEGAFGGGPGATLDFGNRLELGLQARWSLTEFVTAREKRQLAHSKLTQAQLTLEDVQAKLTFGVQEAREAILSGKEQIIASGEMVKHASETYRLSNLRLQENAPGNSVTEVVQSIRGLQLAHANYLQSLRDYNKAQIRLMLLLGPAACSAPR